MKDDCLRGHAEVSLLIEFCRLEVELLTDMSAERLEVREDCCPWVVFVWVLYFVRSLLR